MAAELEAAQERRTEEVRRGLQAEELAGHGVEELLHGQLAVGAAHHGSVGGLPELDPRISFMTSVGHR